MAHVAEDDYTVDWSEKVAGLVEMARDDQVWYAGLARELTRPGDRTAVDVGCGGGGMTLALASAMGPDSIVVAADTVPQMLQAVQARLDGLDRLDDLDRLYGRADRARVRFVVADLGEDLAAVRDALERPADLVWASASVHHVGDQQAAVGALAGLLAPAGRLALAEGGLTPRYLPWDLGVGEPGLELRLEAAHDRWFARMRAELPGWRPMPYGWTTALRRAGLIGVTTRSSLRERSVPLSAHDREQVLDRLGRLVDKLRPTGLLEPDDLAVWQRLLDPADEAWLGRREDLQRLDARSVHLGVREAA